MASKCFQIVVLVWFLKSSINLFVFCIIHIIHSHTSINKQNTPQPIGAQESSGTMPKHLPVKHHRENLRVVFSIIKAFCVNKSKTATASKERKCASWLFRTPWSLRQASKNAHHHHCRDKPSRHHRQVISATKPLARCFDQWWFCSSLLVAFYDRMMKFVAQR